MDIIPCIKWVQRGLAKSIPDKVRLHYFSLENKLHYSGVGSKLKGRGGGLDLSKLDKQK